MGGEQSTHIGGDSQIYLAQDKYSFIRKNLTIINTVLLLPQYRDFGFLIVLVSLPHVRVRDVGCMYPCIIINIGRSCSVI